MLLGNVVEHLVYWLLFNLLLPNYTADAPDLGGPKGLLGGGVLSYTTSLLPSASHVRQEPGRGHVSRLKDSRQNKDPIRSKKKRKEHRQIWNKNQEEVSMVTAT